METPSEVLQRFEAEAKAECAQTFNNIISEPQAALDSLAKLEAVRRLTDCEKSIKAGLFKLIVMKPWIKASNEVLECVHNAFRSIAPKTKL
jgi:hypothetical protein